MDFGEDKFEQPKPLTTQEQGIFDTLVRDVRQAMSDCGEWLEQASGKEVSRDISFKIKLSGDPLKEFVYMKHLMIDGFGAYDKATFVRKIIEAGIHTIYDQLMAGKLQAVMRHSMSQVLPQAMRDAIMTDTIRALIKEVVQASASDEGLASMFKDIKPMAPIPSQQSVNEEHIPGSGKPTAEQSAEVVLCAQCEKPVPPGTGSWYEGKRFHTDCLIDYGLSQQQGGAS